MPNYTEQQLYAINHARREPTVPRKRIAGTQATHHIAHLDVQLLVSGEELAIAEPWPISSFPYLTIYYSELHKICSIRENSHPKRRGGLFQASVVFCELIVKV